MKLALIGLGMVARTHVNAIRAIGGDCQLVGVLSRDTARAAQFVQECNEDIGPRDDAAASMKIYNDVAEIADDPDVDIAVICTPPNARMEMVNQLASAGKHILIEKPLERTLAAATKIVETCENHGVLLGVFLQHRMRESARELRSVLNSGSLGDLAVVEIYVPWWREQSYYDEPGRGTYERDGGGVLISQSIHTIDLALHLIGPVSRVQAMARTSGLHNLEAEDFVSAGLEFENGAVGSLVASTASFPGGAESIIIHGTKGSAKLTSGKLELDFRDGRNQVIGEDSNSGGGADPMAFTHAWHQAIVEDFISALKDNRAPAVTGRNALQVQAVIETLIQSSKQGCSLAVPSMESA